MLVYENIRAPAGQGAAGLHLGQDHLRQSDQAARRRSRRSTSTSRWSPTTTATSCARSSSYAPHAGLVLRLRVPNTGSMVELSSKFGCDPGEAVDLIEEAFRHRARGRGPELPRRQPVHQLRELRAGAQHGGRGDAGGHDRAATRSRSSTSAAASRCPTTGTSSRFSALAQKINAEIDRLFPPGHRDPGRAGPVPGGHRRHRRWRASSARPSATARPATTSTTASTTPSRASSSTTASTTSRRSRRGKTEICAVFGQTCDGLDTISQSEELPDLEIDDLVYSENIGAYSNASATWFNGFPPAKVVHVNE